jgi:hypothetical protein
LNLKELLDNPTEFDGKRIRVSGYYHQDYHCSNLTFGEKSGTDPKQGVWIDNSSTYADMAHIVYANDSYVTVEGSFLGHPSGAFGAWPVSIERITLIKRP